MPRKPELEPRWLVGLLVAWGRRERREALGGLGYYSINPMLRSGIPNPARSYEPVGYGGSDLEDLEKAMRRLEKPRLLAVVRYAMPEKARGIDAENHYSADSWLRHLKAGLAELALDLDRNRLRIERDAATVAEI